MFNHNFLPFSSNFFIHKLLDHDECSADTDICSQVCHNSHSSYYCSCNLGYNTSDGGVTCNGNPLKCSTSILNKQANSHVCIYFLATCRY